MNDPGEIPGFTFTPCHACGFIVEHVSPADRSRALPTAGSLMVCLACGALSILDTTPSLGLFMRPPTPDEHRRALTNPELVRVLAARAVAQRRAGSDWNP